MNKRIVPSNIPFDVQPIFDELDTSREYIMRVFGAVTDMLSQDDAALLNRWRDMILDRHDNVESHAHSHLAVTSKAIEQRDLAVRELKSEQKAKEELRQQIGAIKDAMGLNSIEDAEIARDILTGKIRDEISAMDSMELRSFVQQLVAYVHNVNQPTLDEYDEYAEVG